MTSVDATRAAQATLDEGQALLDQVISDNRQFDAVLRWLAEASDRVHRLEEYYRGPVQHDVAAVLAETPDAVTPPVANEDAAWEALTDFDDRMRRLLRIVTAALTAILEWRRTAPNRERSPPAQGPWHTNGLHIEASFRCQTAAR